jgi:hypothetical protein
VSTTYSESDYINLTNLAKLRVASNVLSSVLPHGVVSEALVKLALRITARLVVYLESRLNEDEGNRSEWPQGPCLKPVEVPCSSPKSHDGECS